VGSVAVKGPDGARFLNRGYMIDDQGVVRGHYDKIHMFDIQLSETELYRESASVAPGDRAVIHQTPLGALGHTICYDLRFPALYRALAQAGAQILTAPAAFTAKTGAAHWHVLTRARAVETTSYMASACAVGAVPGGGAAYGHSLIVAPWGEVLAEGSADGPCVITAEIDWARVEEARRKIPSLTHDRDISFGAPEVAAVAE
jgi:predicted amidohydrolase